MIRRTYCLHAFLKFDVRIQRCFPDVLPSNNCTAQTLLMRQRLRTLPAWGFVIAGQVVSLIRLTHKPCATVSGVSANKLKPAIAGADAVSPHHCVYIYDLPVPNARSLICIAYSSNTCMALGKLLVDQLGSRLSQRACDTLHSIRGDYSLRVVLCHCSERRTEHVRNHLEQRDVARRQCRPCRCLGRKHERRERTCIAPTGVEEEIARE